MASTPLLHAIVEGEGKASDIQGRVGQTCRQVEETSDYNRETLQERLAKLAGGVVVINVGAATETDRIATSNGSAVLLCKLAH